MTTTLTTMPIELAPLPFARQAAGVKAFNVKRGNATSGDPYSQVNLCDYTGDAPAHVVASRQALCQRLGIAPSRLIMPRQTHTCNVATIGDDFLGLPYGEQRAALHNIDALVTTLHGVCLCVNTADCVNLVLIDPVAGVIGVTHAGWRGTAARIAARTVQAMERLGASPARTLATMGVSICQRCFEVGDEVVDAFAQSGFNASHIMRRDPVTGKAHISLQQANRLTLEAAGVPQSNIIATGVCSRENTSQYFSARKLGVNSGRTCTGIILE